MRWDLLDKFDVLQRGSYSRATKLFDGSEDFFAEHFPGRPLVPQTLLIEMIAQAGGVLFGLGIDFQKEVILAKITQARFPSVIAPPCELTVEARIEEQREEGAWVAGNVSRDGQTVAEARILLAAVGSLGEEQKKKVVFNDKFMRHFDIRNVARRSEALR